MADDDDKTEEPSQKKIDQAHENGQVVMSRELNSWAILATAAIITAMILGTYTSGLADKLKIFIARPDIFVMDSGGLHALFYDTMRTIGLYVLLPVFALLIVGIAAPLLQAGPILAWSKLQPSWGKLNPIAGFKKLFGFQSIVELIKGLIKLSIVGGVTTAVLLPYVIHGESLIGQDISVILAALRHEIVQLFIVTLSIMFALAVADYLYQRHQFIKSLRMSKQEIKDEYKQAEGDPHVKGKIKQMRMLKSRQRMMARVPDANVIITNPTHFAVALEYDRDKMDAPIVIAKGQDDVALRIRDVAKEHNIPIVENPPLARGLYASLEIDDAITEEHYKAVAEVISYVYSLKRGR